MYVMHAAEHPPRREMGARNHAQGGARTLCRWQKRERSLLNWDAAKGAHRPH